ncbi:tetratricopeptide repeat protein [Clostridium ljungdahlii]|uniref:Photosystem I assembly protein Ycf3 n=1 Tax=Clostridium ljungdahlii TaxID=1538 RepID=A0A162KSB3_9CLOT|nr:tetratricopeptide repeat protein [Clostridium ljungdahlii]OAA83276.1 Photosystem I assembly protein Ycf3 [Clostridium ljungdahlii]
MHTKFTLKKSMFKFLLITFMFLSIQTTVVLASSSDNVNINTLNLKIENLEKENNSLRNDLNKISRDKLVESYKEQNESILKSTDACIRNLTIIIAAISAVITLLAAVGTIAFPIMSNKKEKERFNEMKAKIYDIEKSLDLKINEINTNLDERVSLSNNSFENLGKNLNSLKDDVTKLLNNAAQSAKEAKESENIAKSYSLESEALKLYNDKNYTLALEKYNEAIKLNPNNSSTLCNRGRLYERLGKYDLALNDYNSALNVNPNHFITINNKADLYRKVGKLDLASKEIAVALNIDNNDPYNLATAAEIALDKNDKEDFYRNVEKSFENGLPLNVIYQNDIYKKVLDEPKFKQLLEKYKKNDDKN